MLPHKKTYQILIEGTVQGVGFRPFVYRKAKSLSVMGMIRNTYLGAEICCVCTTDVLQQFIHQIQNEAPTAAQISNVHYSEIQPGIQFSDFHIEESSSQKLQMGLITPEHAICDICMQELTDPQNRRFQYPFITCCTCGPRYGILKNLPFERKNTSMQNFELCEDCIKDYTNPNNRRFHAQTISCENCGPQLSAKDSDTNQWIYGNKNCVNHIIQQLNDGKIVAIKGLGGFLLLCDAQKNETLEQLRQRKHRPSKPLAMLFPKKFPLEKYFEINEDEQAILHSKIAPIVLLRAKKKVLNRLIAIQDIAPNLHTFGVILPSTALLQLISFHFGKPLVATSANLSGSPIIFENEKALNDLKNIAQTIVIDNRDLHLGQDDSVVQYANKQIIILRRARGLAPNYGKINNISAHENIIALGAGLKHTLSIYAPPYIYTSQYFGNSETIEIQNNIIENFTHLRSILHINKGRYVSDGHPLYFSTQWGSVKNAFKIPHHKAHFAAVLAENKLFEQHVLGVIFDGSGWHPDGHVRGGEFYEYRSQKVAPVGSFAHFQQILKDKMSLEPRISALSLTFEENYLKLQQQFNINEWAYYNKLLKNRQGIPSHSVGRMFDAIASLLELCDKQDYEGKAALLVENCAFEFENLDLELRENYLPTYFNVREIPTQAIFKHVLEDIQNNVSKNKIAFKFHLSLVMIIKQVAEQLAFKNISFSGGVFQNRLLVQLLNKHLSATFKLYFHKQLSPNDENISFGQLNYYLQQLN